MQIRLKIWEIIVVALGFLLAGIMIGLTMTEEFSLSFGLTMVGLTILPILSLIVKRRYKVLTAKQIKSIRLIKRNLN